MITEPILFILLVIFSQKTEFDDIPTFNYLTENRITTNIHIDRQGAMKQRSDVVEWNMYHYKAILFYSKDTLNHYLRDHNVDGCTLIDIKNGKQFVVRQEAIRDTVMKREVITRGWKFKLSTQ